MLEEIVREVNSHIAATQQMQLGLIAKLQPVLATLEKKIQDQEAEIAELKKPKVKRLKGDKLNG